MLKATVAAAYPPQARAKRYLRSLIVFTLRSMSHKTKPMAPSPKTAMLAADSPSRIPSNHNNCAPNNVRATVSDVAWTRPRIRPSPRIW